MLKFEIKPELGRKLKNIKSKNIKEFRNIQKKILQIADNTTFTLNRYKNLKKPLNEYKRVHINTSFVLIFKYDIDKKLIIFEDYEHHDKIY